MGGWVSGGIIPCYPKSPQLKPGPIFLSMELAKRRLFRRSLSNDRFPFYDQFAQPRRTPTAQVLKLRDSNPATHFDNVHSGKTGERHGVRVPWYPRYVPPTLEDAAATPFGNTVNDFQISGSRKTSDCSPLAEREGYSQNLTEV